MASKNLEFTIRLKKTIKEMGLKPPAFALKAEMKYPTLMNYLKKGAEGHVPEWDQLVKISDASGKSIDWLLTGKMPETDARHPCAGLEEHCPKIKNILLSNHSVITAAFLANIAAFDHSINKEKEQDEKIRTQGRDIKSLKDEVKNLNKALSKGQLTGTDQAASSSTGK